MPYDLVKTSVVRLGEALARELAPHGVTAASVTPGYLRLEMMLNTFGVTEATWREAAARVEYFEHSETPHVLGRGVAALAANADRARFAGRYLGSRDLMRHYGFTDADGRQPNWGAGDREVREQTLSGGHPAAEG